MSQHLIAVGLGGKHEVAIDPAVDTVGSVKAKLEPLTSLDEIMDMLKLDDDNPLVYSVYREMNKNKLSEDKIQELTEFL